MSEKNVDSLGKGDIPRPPEDPVPDPPRKLPQQGRSRFMVDSIIEACDRVLQKEGVEALTATRIADVAGVTRGSMYQYFPNVEAIMTTLYEQKILQHLKGFTNGDTLVFADLEDRLGTLEAMTQIMIDFHKDMLALNEPYYRKYLNHFDLTRWFDEIRGRPNASIEFTKMMIGGEEGSENVDMAAFLVAHQIMALSVAAQKHPEYLENPDFAKMLLAMCKGVFQK